jgi:hypothetical protein
VSGQKVEGTSGNLTTGLNSRCGGGDGPTAMDSGGDETLMV